MQEVTAEAEEFLKSVNAETENACDDKSVADSRSEQGESETDVILRQTRTLLSRIDDFRQSYNRTHGQVCEFFERARVVQKLGLLDPTQAAQLVALSGDEADEDDCNSIVDCNYADGQKTTGMKRKLRKWRKVMRSALMEICPELGLENQPDINPGLMKHILDEVRTLKSQLAFQHSNILQLAHKTEMYRLDSEQKEQFISDLLQNCKGIRLDSELPNGIKDMVGEGAPSKQGAKEPELPLPAALEDIQFGRSKELINALNLEAETLSGAEADQLIVDPIDFAKAQKQLQLLSKQTEAIADVAMTSDALSKAGGPSATSFLTGSSAVRSRGFAALDLQSRLPTHEFTTDRANGSSSIQCGATTSVNIAPNRGTVAVPRRRHFLVNLGGSLTVAVLGGLAINSFQRRGQQ